MFMTKNDLNDDANHQKLEWQLLIDQTFALSNNHRQTAVTLIIEPLCEFLQICIPE